MGKLDKHLKEVTNVLLIQPNFPTSTKSKNHKDFCPIGLLKLASYLRTKNINVQLIHHCEDNTITITPQLILVTTLFTYWSKYVKETVTYYRELFPHATIIGGGVYASLLPEHCKEYANFDDVITGIIPEAEELTPAYDLVDIDYQIIHTTRGCIRRCDFCGVYKIEPTHTFKKSIKDEIIKNKIIFYDNNFLANPYVDKILNELILLKKQHKIKYAESQSGFDGRLLLNKPHLAKKLKLAGFKNVRIAWDHGLEDKKSIHQQVKLLIKAGFNPRDIQIFMIYNYELPYIVLEQKRVECYKMGVGIADCRFRPLNITYDNYNPWKQNQTSKEYYISSYWTDTEVKTFRRNCRRHNLCISRNQKWHSNKVELKKYPLDVFKDLKSKSYEYVKTIIPDAWNPETVHNMLK